jgi:hypothetical protein
VQRLPLDAYGLAPRISRWSVRSRSGTAMSRGLPKRYPLDTCFGIWSTVEAEKTLRLPIALMRVALYRVGPREWTLGLPR